jgi:hypothetical protein
LIISQIKIPHSGYVAVEGPIYIDSVFNKFVKPNLPEKYYKLEWTEINILCEVQVNKEGKVESIYSYPVNKNHFHFSQEDSIWKDAENAILESSKLWEFKSVVWDIESIEPVEAKELYTKYNNEKRFLPFNGVPSYLLLIKFCHECRHRSGFTFISLIKI